MITARLVGDYMQRNDRLRRHRIARNWRQKDVADQLDISVITIQRWERGTQQPSAFYRVKLCALFEASAQELGLIDESTAAPESDPELARQPSAVAAERTEIWTVPYARNPHFTGRDELLDQLMQQLALKEPGQPTTMHQATLTQAQAIKGLGGIGKTQIAVEYAYRARKQGRFTHTLWIAAGSLEAILTSYVALADHLPAFPSKGETDQHTLVAAIIRWLEQCEQSWLLIADNADDLSLIQPYLPRRGNGSILLTTRAQAVGSLASSFEVDTMGVMEGTHLLLRRAQRLNNATDEEMNEATNIVIALGQFPLALDQAGAYIEETGCSLRDYLQFYQTHRYALLARRGKQATLYPESVATTWSLSFQHVAQATPAAAELLRLCTFLAPDHIPEELFVQGAAHWPLSLQQAVADPFTFNQLLEPLLAFSLVKRLSEDRLLSIHRLVQVVQMEQMEAQEQRQWAERVVCAVNDVFPHNPKKEVDTWPQCQRYLEQAQACDTLAQQYQILLPEAAELLDRTGAYLSECALYKLAEPLFQRAVWIREQQEDPESLPMAELLYNLALLYSRQGKYAEAKPLHQRALHIREQQVGPEDPLVGASLNGLAMTYYQLGRYAETEPLFQRVLHIQEQKLGSTHLSMAAPLNNLALLYSRQGKYTEAELFYKRALDIREQQLGPEHPYVVYSLNNLANLYQDQGRYAQAEPLYQRAIRIREQQLGPEHPDLAHPLEGLANLYRAQGQYTQAEPLYQRALHLREQQLASEHPLVAASLNSLANLYRDQGQYAQAEPLYQRALHIYEQQLGSEHIDVADVLHDFAGSRQAEGKTSEAASLYQRALTIREQVLGADNPLTTESREHLHAVLLALS